MFIHAHSHFPSSWQGGWQHAVIKDATYHLGLSVLCNNPLGLLVPIRKSRTSNTSPQKWKRAPESKERETLSLLYNLLSTEAQIRINHQIFRLLSPWQKKKKSFQALSELSKDDYVDKHGVCYLKKTDQSILHILKRESVIKKDPG